MRSLTLLLILLITPTPFFQGSDGVKKQSGQIYADNPTVYLNYLCQDERKIYLRMYNNTTWHISVTTDELYYPSKKPIKLLNGVNTYATPNDKEISLQYRVEKYALSSESINVPKVNYSDNGFSSWIAARDSIFFSVPVKYLRKDLQIFVRFNYEWEITRQGDTINAPEHKVSFRGLDLLDIKPSACGTY
jgi:hypothetical protein